MAEPIRMNMLQPPTPIEAPTDQAILTLAQWLSPAYPIGSFAYSHGLETAIQSGAIADKPSLQDWLTDILQYGSGRNDCILLREGYAARDPKSLAVVNNMGLAFAASAERRLEAELQGAAFCKVTKAIWGGEDLAYIYPVAVGAAAARQNIPVDLTAGFYLQATISNLISAAQRLMPLGQTDAQAMLASLTPLCQGIAAQTREAGLDDMHSSTFLSDISAMRHETQEPRIFRS